MGNNIGIDDYAFINSDVQVIIEDYVSIACFAHVFPSGHDIRTCNFAFTGSPIRICYGAFIGTGAFVGPGVTIGRMAVVGLNTSIYKDVPDNMVAHNISEIKLKNRLSEEDFSKFILKREIS